MLSLDKINETILELERSDTTFATCEKLAACYIVRDHLEGYNVAQGNAIAQKGSSDFLQAINGKNPDQIWLIMDELMEAVGALHPKIYDKVLEKIKEA